MAYIVRLDNDTERELVQKILFLEGYVWGSSRDKTVRYVDDDEEFNYAIVYPNDMIFYREGNNRHNEEDMSFKQLLDKIENEHNDK